MNNTSRSALLLITFFLIPTRGDDLRQWTSWNAEFHRRDCRITENFTAELANGGNVFVEVVHLNSEVMNARTFTSSPGHSGFIIVVFEKREIDFTVAQAIPGPVFRSGFAHRRQTEHFFIKLCSLVQIFHFKCNMGDARHVFPPSLVCGSYPNSR